MLLIAAMNLCPFLVCADGDLSRRGPVAATELGEVPVDGSAGSPQMGLGGAGCSFYCSLPWEGERFQEMRGVGRGQADLAHDDEPRRLHRRPKRRHELGFRG